MAHGGTNFGLWAGANHDGTRIHPTVTSYDSDAPIAEHGAPTPKFFALRDRLAELTGAEPRPLPGATPLLAPGVLPVVRGAGLIEGLSAMSTAVTAPHPLSFEDLAQPSGLVLYRARPLLPSGTHELTVYGLHDRAQVFLDGVPAGVIDQETGSLPVEGAGRRLQLDLLVENQGRINYGPLLGQGKGILGGIRVGRRLVHQWETYGLPLDEWSAEDVRRAPNSASSNEDAENGEPGRVDTGPGHGPGGFGTARLTLDGSSDAFLAFPGFGKGFVWINGTLLGRYWEIGPQVTLYVPAPLLRPGDNTITVLELERFGERIELREGPELGPELEYVEAF
jgi:beta-galactosidase